MSFHWRKRYYESRTCDGFFFLHSFSLHKMLTYGLESYGLLVRFSHGAIDV